MCLSSLGLPFLHPTSFPTTGNRYQYQSPQDHNCNRLVGRNVESEQDAAEQGDPRKEHIGHPMKEQTSRFFLHHVHPFRAGLFGYAGFPRLPETLPADGSLPPDGEGGA